jgi:hypothetical protein
MCATSNPNRRTETVSGYSPCWQYQFSSRIAIWTMLYRSFNSSASSRTLSQSEGPIVRSVEDQLRAARVFASLASDCRKWGSSIVAGFCFALPLDTRKVHMIETDDPAGVEARRRRERNGRASSWRERRPED